MKRVSLVIAGVASLVWLALASPALADDSKEMTITGEGKCGKCALKETSKCQNVIVVEKDGKTEKYYVAENSVSKDFHENLCHGPKKVTATGTVKTVDGKMEFTATKMELAKDK
jgi:hypothetical protein